MVCCALSRPNIFATRSDIVLQVGTGDFAIRESLSRIKIFKNFKEELTVKPPMSAPEGIFGGACLAVRGADCVCFFDWNMGTFICKIDVAPTAHSRDGLC